MCILSGMKAVLLSTIFVDLVISDGNSECLASEFSVNVLDYLSFKCDIVSYQFHKMRLTLNIC